MKKFVYDVLRYIGDFVVALEGLDALVLTGGIGENSAGVRSCVCRRLAYLGLALDEEANAEAKGETRITESSSSVAARVIPANEELVVAREVQNVLRSFRR